MKKGACSGAKLQCGASKQSHYCPKHESPKALPFSKCASTAQGAQQSHHKATCNQHSQKHPGMPVPNYPPQERPPCPGYRHPFTNQEVLQIYLWPCTRAPLFINQTVCSILPTLVWVVSHVRCTPCGHPLMARGCSHASLSGSSWLRTQARVLPQQLIQWESSNT